MGMSVASRSSFCLCVPDDAYQARGEESVRDATVQLQERDENDPGWPWKNTDDATASLRRVPELQVGSSFHECPHFSCANKRRRCCRRTSCWWNFVCSYWQRRTHWLFTLYALSCLLTGLCVGLQGCTPVLVSLKIPKGSIDWCLLSVWALFGWLRLRVQVFKNQQQVVLDVRRCGMFSEPMACEVNNEEVEQYLRPLS